MKLERLIYNVSHNWWKRRNERREKLVKGKKRFGFSRTMNDISLERSREGNEWMIEEGRCAIKNGLQRHQPFLEVLYMNRTPLNNHNDYFGVD